MEFGEDTGWDLGRETVCNLGRGKDEIWREQRFGHGEDMDEILVGEGITC